MIDLKEYGIKIRFFALHPAGEVDHNPFIVITKDFPKWYWQTDNAQQVISAWRDFFEEHRGQTLIIHELQPYRIRYSVVKDDAEWAGQYD